MKNFNASRRQFLRQTSLTLAGMSFFPTLAKAMNGMGMGAMHSGSSHALLPKIAPNKASINFKADVELELMCKPAAVQIFDGSKTQVLQYRAQLIKGPQGTLTEMANTYLGSIIRLQKGQKVRIHLRNGLSQPTVTHWHGLHVPQKMDGHVQYVIEPSETLVYEFEVLNRASFNLYHPHPHGATARQFYMGLAGGIIINDEQEAALQLPSGEREIPIVIQDKMFDSDNQLFYSPMMHSKMTGFAGDKILVNGQPNFQLNVDSCAYRLRVMNGSTSRIYKLAWENEMPVTVIGVDGGLLEHPENKPYVMLAPGERLDVWADFSALSVGTQLSLKSLAFSGVLPKMGMMHRSALAIGSEYSILSVNIKRKVSDSHALPKQLSEFKRHAISETANASSPIPIAISEAPMAMLLNGRAYEFNQPLPFERVKLGSLQLIEIFHASTHAAEQNDVQGNQHRRMGMMGGGMGMNLAMAHPIHLHGQSFEIISRSVSGDSADYESVKEGFINSGLKDTVLMMPNERVKIIKPFEDFKGLFLYHCHNLEHEDMGMMREFLVE